MLRSLSLLLAEEDDAMREVLDAALHAAGYETLEVRTAGELLRFVEEAHRGVQGRPAIDAIVCEVTLPGHTRQTLLARLGKVSRASSLPARETIRGS